MTVSGTPGGVVMISHSQLVNGLLRRKRFFETQSDHFPREARIHVTHAYGYVSREVELVQPIPLRGFSTEAPSIQVTVASDRYRSVSNIEASGSSGLLVSDLLECCARCLDRLRTRATAGLLSL